MALAFRVLATAYPSFRCRLGLCIQLDRESTCHHLHPNRVYPSLTVVSQFTFLVVEITPISIKSIGYKTYIYFCVFNACFVPLIWWFYPETANLSLEQIDLLFTGDKVLLQLPSVSAAPPGGSRVSDVADALAAIEGFAPGSAPTAGREGRLAARKQREDHRCRRRAR